MPRMSKKRKLELSFFLNDRGRVAYNCLLYTSDVYKRQLQNRTVVIRQNRQLIFSRKRAVLANDNALPANQPQNRAQNPTNQKRRMF